MHRLVRSVTISVGLESAYEIINVLASYLRNGIDFGVGHFEVFNAVATLAKRILLLARRSVTLRGR